MKNIVLLFSLMLFFSSCEEQMVVIPDFAPLTTGKVVLIEDLTGVSCPNCPAGSERLESIAQLFPNNVVIVGVHGGLLADPLSTSKYDFRSDAGVFLDQFLKPYAGKPSAYFNRIRYEELEPFWGHPVNGQWQGYVERELEKEQVLQVSITKNYDPETRVLEVTVGALALIPLSGEFKLTIMLTESGIVDAQDDQSEVIEDYVHKHVLRDIVTNFDGDFFTNTLEPGNPVAKTYTYTIPEDETGLWNDDEIEVVAFIANTEGESEEVLQAANTKLKD
ncbi:MAG: Omp28-related outer membrane protein [Bacteroidota bacterium]